MSKIKKEYTFKNYQVKFRVNSSNMRRVNLRIWDKEDNYLSKVTFNLNPDNSYNMEGQGVQLNTKLLHQMVTVGLVKVSLETGPWYTFNPLA